MVRTAIHDHWIKLPNRSRVSIQRIDGEPDGAGRIQQRGELGQFEAQDAARGRRRRADLASQNIGPGFTEKARKSGAKRDGLNETTAIGVGIGCHADCWLSIWLEDQWDVLAVTRNRRRRLNSSASTFGASTGVSEEWISAPLGAVGTQPGRASEL